MRIPSKLKIGPHTWRVTRPKFIRSTPEEKALNRVGDGECVFDRHHIKVRSGMLESDAAETLLHEIIHALIAPIPLSSKIDESVAQTIGNGLLQVIRDNKLDFRE